METPYTVPEIARLTGIPETTLYDYVRQFSGVVPEMEASEENGRTRRPYPEQAIAVFQTIRHLKDRGVDAPTIRALLQESKTEEEAPDTTATETVYVSYGGSEADAGTTAEAEATETIAVDFAAGEAEVHQIPVEGPEVTAAASEALPQIDEQILLEFAPPGPPVEEIVEPVSPFIDASAAATNGATPTTGEEILEALTGAIPIAVEESLVSSPAETLQASGSPVSEPITESQPSLSTSSDALLAEAPVSFIGDPSYGDAPYGLEPTSSAAIEAETPTATFTDNGATLSDLVSTPEATADSPIEATVSSVEPDLMSLQGQLLGSLEAGLRGLRDLIDTQHGRNDRLQDDLALLQAENERLRVTIATQKEQQRSVQHLLAVIKEQCEQGIRTVAE